MLESKAKPAAKPKNGEAKATKRTTTKGTAGKSAAPQDVQERIQRRAYELWESEGRPEGRAQVHWRQAELEVTRARSQRVGASR
jgi:hypothetical protein